ncbi:hypothetical protein ACFYOG_33130 [Streptomyces sp. NPDC007818]|uniref:hypothetical protein n=1 Tax=Streptomyces sp. NPDC007818 TaxID=3364780 RepID=UPI0036B0CF98
MYPPRFVDTDDPTAASRGGMPVSGEAKIGALIGRDVCRYLVVFCGVWVAFLGAFMVLEGGPVEEYVDLLAGLLVITGLPSLSLVVIARLLARKGGIGVFPATCGTLLLLPALFPLLMGVWTVCLVQVAVLIGFLTWSAWRTRTL